MFKNVYLKIHKNSTGLDLTGKTRRKCNRRKFVSTELRPPFTRLLSLRFLIGKNRIDLRIKKNQQYYTVECILMLGQNERIPKTAFRRVTAADARSHDNCRMLYSTGPVRDLCAYSKHIIRRHGTPNSKSITSSSANRVVAYGFSG